MAKKPTLRLKTHMSYEDLEQLLETRCRQSVQMLFEGLEGEANQSRKVITLVFESETDHDSFRASLGGERTAP